MFLLVIELDVDRTSRVPNVRLLHTEIKQSNFLENKGETWSAVAEKEISPSVQNVGNATGVAVNNFLNGIRASFRSATQSTELRSSNDKN